MITPPNNLAVLVGNGLSIAFNPALTIPKITIEIVARLNAAGASGTTPAKIMQQVAQNLMQGSGDAYSDFEALLGPFDQQADSLKMLRQLADLAGPHSTLVANALDLSAEFVDSLRRYGVGHALDIIANRSRADWALVQGVHDFIIATVQASRGGRVTFGNLNYDSLVMAALTHLYGGDLCDMTNGREFPSLQQVVDGTEWGIPGRPLRVIADYPPYRRIRLLHLHGSLAWLRAPGTTGASGVMRFDIDPLRNAGYWQAWREGRSGWTPEVVLTNQTSKDTIVRQYPFSLAYDSFYDELRTADRWLIAGYSFRDGCVNELLMRAWAVRKTVPQVMVVTKGHVPEKDEVLDALGFDPVNNGDPDPSGWLHVYRGGLETAPKSPAWRNWRGDAASGIAAS